MTDLPTCWHPHCTAEVAGLYRLTGTTNTEWCCVEHSRGHAWIEGLPVAQPVLGPTREQIREALRSALAASAVAYRAMCTVARRYRNGWRPGVGEHRGYWVSNTGQQFDPITSAEFDAIADVEAPECP